MERNDDLLNQNSGNNDQYSANMNKDNNQNQVSGNNQQDSKYAKGYDDMTTQNAGNWQDHSTGSMGSQMSGGRNSLNSGSMDDNQPSGMTNKPSDITNKSSESYNTYGQSKEQMDKIKSDEKMIRDGYRETPESDTNPYLRDMWDKGTENEMKGQKNNYSQEQQSYGQSGQSGQSASSGKTCTRGGNNQGQQQYNRPPASKRITEEGRDQEIGGPMDAAKNY